MEFLNSRLRGWLGVGWRWLSHAAAVLAPLASAVAALAAVLIAAVSLSSTSSAQNSQAFSSSAAALSDESEGDPRSQEAQHLGGIFGLQGVMADDTARQPAVVAVLAAFIEARFRTDAQSQDSFWSPPDDGCPPRLGAAPNSAPATDVQAAFDVLARRDPGDDNPRAQVDLSATCLGYLSAAEAQMPRVRLTGTDLKHAVLARADLYGINGISLNLSNADLTDAILDQADLRGANLSNGVDAPGASLKGAWMSGADLTAIDLSGADLNGATLGATDAGSEGMVCLKRPLCHQLGSANLTNARLDQADLRGVDLRGVTLSGASMTGTRVDGNQLVWLSPEQVSQVGVD